MITKSIDINKFTRMRFFDGLFLQQDEFRTDQDFYLTVRRYINYLLFDPGVLFTTDPGPSITTSTPLKAAPGTGLTIDVAPGIGLIIDPPAEMAYEVELPTAQNFDAADIATAGLDAGGSVIKVILHRDDNDFILNASAADRTVERAQVSLVAPADLLPAGPFGGTPYIELATLTVNATGDALTETSDDRLRGGIKLSILSQQVYSMLVSSTPVPVPTPVLTDFIGVDEPNLVDIIRITGSNFSSAPSTTTAGVEFTDTSAVGGFTDPITVPAANVDPTEIRLAWLNASAVNAAILANAERGPVRVTIAPHGAVTSTFDFVPPPITDTLPATHSISGSPQLTISGQRFYSSTGFPEVEFVPTTGAPSTTGVDSGSTDNSLIVTMPSTVGPGNYAIRVETRGGTIEAGSVIFLS